MMLRSTKSQPTTDLVKTYLQEIGRVPLLTPEQEVSYGRRVQAMMKLRQVKQSLAESLKREPTLAEWAEEAQIPKAQLQQTLVRGEGAKQKMLKANLRLVVSIAKKYQKRNLELLDLIQEGSIGLERGVEKFDPTQGYRFSTYAYWWIRQGITRAIAQQSRSIRLPIHINETLNKLKRHQRELMQKLGRAATVAELAEALDLDVAKVREYLDLGRQPLSLDLRLGENQDMELQDILEDDRTSPEDYTWQEGMKHDFATMLADLTPQQRQVLILRYGLDDGVGLTLAKIGERMNRSRESIRQLERQAIARLRHRQGQMRQYLAG